MHKKFRNTFLGFRFKPQVWHWRHRQQTHRRVTYYFILPVGSLVTEILIGGVIRQPSEIWVRHLIVRYHSIKNTKVGCKLESSFCGVEFFFKSKMKQPPYATKDPFLFREDTTFRDQKSCETPLYLENNKHWFSLFNISCHATAYAGWTTYFDNKIITRILVNWFLSYVAFSFAKCPLAKKKIIKSRLVVQLWTSNRTHQCGVFSHENAGVRLALSNSKINKFQSCPNRLSSIWFL